MLENKDLNFQFSLFIRYLIDMVKRLRLRKAGMIFFEAIIIIPPAQTRDNDQTNKFHLTSQ